MTKDERIASFKYSVLQHARENKNITSTCKAFNLSRTIYYEWLRRLNQLGYLGLMDRKRSMPKMPNQIRPDFEAIIYNYIVNYPTHGPRRIAFELKIQGIIISETGVYNVLRRANLNHRLSRLFYAREHSDNPVITERYLREIEKKRETHIKAYYPGGLPLLSGYLLCRHHQELRKNLSAGLG